jgi:hypothetical protein
MPIADKPAEIEITDAMIAAAARELAAFNDDYGSFKEGAERILRSAFGAAMERSAP